MLQAFLNAVQSGPDQRPFRICVSRSMRSSASAVTGLEVIDLLFQSLDAGCLFGHGENHGFQCLNTFRHVLGNLADHDEESRPSLLFTLKIVLEQNRSWQAAAEKLHIHKTSLNYRLRRGGG